MDLLGLLTETSGPDFVGGFMYNYSLIQHKASERFNWALAIFWTAALMGLAYGAYEFLGYFDSIVRSVLK